MTTPSIAIVGGGFSGTLAAVHLGRRLPGVPIILFDDLFHVPVIGLPIGNHDNNQHAANENLRLRNLWDGIALYAAMMADLNW